MILVPVEKYERLQKQVVQEQELPSVQTVGDEVSRIDAQMHDVLNSVNNKNEREKAIQFSQLVQKLLLQKGVLNSSVNKRSKDDSLYEEEDGENELRRADIASIVRLIPNTYKNSAKVLLEHLLQSGVVSWNDHRHLIYKSQTYHNINVVDLINDCVKRKKPEARGLQFFLTILSQIHTPLSFITNPTIKEHLSRANVSHSPSNLTIRSPKITSTPKGKSMQYSITDDESTLERSKSWSKY